MLEEVVEVLLDRRRDHVAADLTGELVLVLASATLMTGSIFSSIRVSKISRIRMLAPSRSRGPIGCRPGT